MEKCDFIHPTSTLSKLNPVYASNLCTRELAYWMLSTKEDGTHISEKSWNKYKNRIIELILEDAATAFPTMKTGDIRKLIERLYLVRKTNVLANKMIQERFSDNINMYSSRPSEYVFTAGYSDEKELQMETCLHALFTSSDPMVSVDCPSVNITKKVDIQNLIDKVIDEVIRGWFCYASILVEEQLECRIDQGNFMRKTVPQKGFLDKDEVYMAGTRMFLLSQMVERFGTEMEFYYLLKQIEKADSDNENGASVLSVKERSDQQMRNLIRDFEYERAEKDKEIASLKEQLNIVKGQKDSYKAKAESVDQLTKHIHKLNKENEHYKKLVSDNDEEEPVSVAEDEEPLQLPAEDNTSDELETTGPEYPYIDFNLQYLFPIYEHMNVEPELKKLFPNARIVHSANDPYPTGTDYVVFITDIMDHTMYTRFKAKGECIHTQKANIPALLEKMNEFFRSKAEKEA